MYRVGRMNKNCMVTIMAAACWNDRPNTSVGVVPIEMLARASATKLHWWTGLTVGESHGNNDIKLPPNSVKML